jgi:hypothetical protein
MSEGAIAAVRDNGDAMASLAGNGLPPTLTDTAVPQGTRLGRDLAFAAVLALLAGTVIAGAVAFYPHASDVSRERAEEAILPVNQVIAESAAALEHAEKLDDLAETGAIARTAIADVELADTEGISDSHVRSAAEELMQAQLAWLSALKPLTRLEEPTVREWRSRRRKIRAAVRQIARAQPAAAELDLTSEMNVWGPVLSWSLANADAVVAKASRRLRTWRSRVQAVREERRVALAAVADYESSVQRYLATYDGLGTDLDDWIRKADTEGATFSEAQRFLGSASTAREHVRDGIAALDAPAGVTAAHARLLSFMDRATAAVESARAGVFQYKRNSKGKYSSLSEAPGWQRFRSESKAAVSESAAARSRWHAAIAAEVEQIKSRKPPKRPDV